MVAWSAEHSRCGVTKREGQARLASLAFIPQGQCCAQTGCGSCMHACQACPAAQLTHSRVHGNSQQGRPRQPTENGVVAIQMRGRVHHDRKVGRVSVGSHVGLQRQQHGALCWNAVHWIAVCWIPRSRTGRRPGVPMLACCSRPTRAANEQGKHANNVQVHAPVSHRLRLRLLPLLPAGHACGACGGKGFRWQAQA